MENIVWTEVKKYQDITYKKSNGVARIAINRPEVRNAFRPKTTSELYDAFYDAHEDPSIGVVLLTGEGPSPKDGVFSFCSGGDQRARGHKGYVGEDGNHRLNILEVQRLIRFMPKVVIAVVPGWAVGGGHSLHVVCDLTLASKEHAIFKQTDADVTSFDGGYGSAYLAKMVGQKKAREIFFLGKNCEYIHPTPNIMGNLIRFKGMYYRTCSLCGLGSDMRISPLLLFLSDLN